MASFKDAEGRVWSLDLDLRTCDLVKEHRGLDLIDPEKFMENITAIMSRGTEHLVNLVWTIIHRQAAKLKVTDEEFGYAMKPQAVADAHAALREGIIDFFRPLNPAVAESMRRVLDKAEAVVASQTESGLAELDNKLNSLVRGLMSENSAGNTAGSAASTPTAAA